MADLRPVLLVTNHVPPSRVGPYRLLLDRHPVEIALFGGRSTHAMDGLEELPFAVTRTGQHQLHGLAASGRYSAVVASTNGRVALPACYLGARRAGVPFVLWATLWSHPRSLAGIVGYPLVRHVYRSADAVATYGPHVSAYVRARGARSVVEAPQAVDNDFWSQPGDRGASPRFVFAGRLEKAKGLEVLLDAWRHSGAAAAGAELVIVGTGSEQQATAGVAGVSALGMLSAEQLRDVYASAHTLVVPSIPARTFLEPWGLVVNEAMNQGLAVIASDTVGAVAGGLVRHERNGLVVGAGDTEALAAAIRRLCDDPPLRDRLGSAARDDVAPYTHSAWVDGLWAAVEAAQRRRGAGSL
jgi:glycosyltransferase involved in cell wall biosynthesis